MCLNYWYYLGQCYTGQIAGSQVWSSLVAENTWGIFNFAWVSRRLFCLHCPNSVLCYAIQFLGNRIDGALGCLKIACELPYRLWEIASNMVTFLS